MLRDRRAISGYALVLLVGAGLASTQCWGESFSSAPPIGGSGGLTSASVTGATSSTTAGGITGAGGNTSAGLVDSTTGAAGEGPLSPSEIDPNCKKLRMPADRDTFIWGMFPDQNRDFVGVGDDRLEVSQYGSASKRVLLRFEVYLNLPADWTPFAAFLEMQVLVADSYGRLNLHRVQGRDWEERVVNWLVFTSGQSWTTPGGDFEAEPFSGLDLNPSLVGTTAVWDVTTEVQRLHAGGENYGWLLKEAGEPAQAYSLNYAFPGRDTLSEDEAVPALVIHFCD